MNLKAGNWNISDFNLGKEEDYSDLLDDKMVNNISSNIQHAVNLEKGKSEFDEQKQFLGFGNQKEEKKDFIKE